MKVADVGRASSFYGEDVGFDEQARLPAAAFLGAGGYHHHIGLNSWQSAGAPRRRTPLRGCGRCCSSWATRAALGELQRRLADRGDEPRELEGRLLVGDPDGQTLAFAIRRLLSRSSPTTPAGAASAAAAHAEALHRGAGRAHARGDLLPAPAPRPAGARRLRAGGAGGARPRRGPPRRPPARRRGSARARPARARRR